MNLLRGTLGWPTAGRWRPRMATSPLGGRPPAAWQPWRDREVVLGIRPEDLQPQRAGDAALAAQLEVIEPVGNEIFLNLRHGDQALVSRVSPRHLPEPGSTLTLELAAERLHLFDAASGARIGA